MGQRGAEQRSVAHLQEGVRQLHGSQCRTGVEGAIADVLEHTANFHRFQRGVAVEGVGSNIGELGCAGHGDSLHFGRCILVVQIISKQEGGDSGDLFTNGHRNAVGLTARIGKGHNIQVFTGGSIPVDGFQRGRIAERMLSDPADTGAHRERFQCRATIKRIIADVCGCIGNDNGRQCRIGKGREIDISDIFTDGKLLKGSTTRKCLHGDLIKFRHRINGFQCTTIFKRLAGKLIDIFGIGYRFQRLTVIECRTANAAGAVSKIYFHQIGAVGKCPRTDHLQLFAQLYFVQSGVGECITSNFF